MEQEQPEPFGRIFHAKDWPDFHLQMRLLYLGTKNGSWQWDETHLRVKCVLPSGRIHRETLSLPPTTLSTSDAAPVSSPSSDKI